MKRRLAWVMAAFLCVTSVPQGTFLSMAAEEISTEAESEDSLSLMAETEESSAAEDTTAPETMETENVETETAATETAATETVEATEAETDAPETINTEENIPETAASETVKTEVPETEVPETNTAETADTADIETPASETAVFHTQEAETEGIAVLSEDEKPTLLDAKIELSADVNLKAGVDFTAEDITVTISYSDGKTWVMKQQPNFDETDPYGNSIAIEILDSEGNRLYGSIDKAGDYTLYVSVYALGESDRRNLGDGLHITVRENAATPFGLGAEEVLESGHNYRTFAPEASGYYWLEGVNIEKLDIRDEAENEIGSIIAFGGENVVSAYYLEQGHTYHFDLQKKRNVGNSQATVRFNQVTEEWNYEEAGIQDKEPGAHFRLLRPKTTTSYVFSTTGASLVIKNSKGEDIFNDAGWEWTLHRSFELDADQTYLVGTYAEPDTGVYASLAKKRTLKNAELKYTWDACYLGFDGLFADRFQLKLTFDDGYETVLNDPEEEDIYGNSLRNMHFGQPGSTDENSRSMIRTVNQEVYEVKVYVNGNEIASTKVNCQPIDFEALPEIKENQEVEIKDPKIRQFYRYTADKNGKYYGDGVNLYTKTDTGWEWVNPRYSTLKAGESYLVYFMAIAKELVELQGGIIEMKSERNVGTTFKIHIPFEIDISAEKEKMISEQENCGSIEGLHILLVEDNELNMEVAEYLLEENGAIITKAWNGKEATDLFSKSKPGDFDVILMDIMMPVMGGWEATRQIRKLERSDAATIPIIAMSANAFQDDIEKSKKEGMNAHIVKPLDIQKVIQTITQFVVKNT